MRFECEVDEVPLRDAEHDCSIGVECEPRTVAGVVVDGWREAVCRCGDHHITESRWGSGWMRQVSHRTSPNNEWQGWKP